MHKLRIFLTSTLLLLVWSISVNAQSNSWPLSPDLPGSRQAVAGHFMAFAQGYAASQGYRISSISQNQLFSRLAARAPQLASSRDAQIAAEEGLIRFVDAMIAAEGASGGLPSTPDSYVVIGERNFLAALGRLCPIWPVCD